MPNYAPRKLIRFRHSNITSASATNAITAALKRMREVVRFHGVASTAQPESHGPLAADNAKNTEIIEELIEIGLSAYDLNGLFSYEPARIASYGGRHEGRADLKVSRGFRVRMNMLALTSHVTKTLASECCRENQCLFPYSLMIEMANPEDCAGKRTGYRVEHLVRKFDEDRFPSGYEAVGVTCYGVSELCHEIHKHVVNVFAPRLDVAQGFVSEALDEVKELFNRILFLNVVLADFAVDATATTTATATDTEAK